METPPAALFPLTAWTLVRRVQGGQDSPDGETALNSLCRIYWEPVRKFLRALGCREDECADVTQDFFASFLRTGGFERADPGVARLRTFIKHASGRYLQNHWRKQCADRRGGGEAVANLADIPEPAAVTRSLAEETYDRDWAQTVLGRALTSVEESYRSRGREAVFSAIKSGLLRTGGVEDVSAVARSLGVPESQIRLAVHRARQRLADALRAEVSATVDSLADADAEVRYLLSVITQT